jgi:hypothetical protein
MNTPNMLNRCIPWTRAGRLAAVAMLLASTCLPALGVITLYSDDFQSYPVQNPAPNPLTNGPANGQWYFVDPTPPMTANKHRIYDSSLTVGGGLNSRCWISMTNNARLTNAITITSLPVGTNLYTFRLYFLAAMENVADGLTCPFAYSVSSSAGSLTFLSGGNADSSQTFTGLTGTGVASSAAKGKTADRRFYLVFQGSGLNVGDKINLDFRHDVAPSSVWLMLDDVTLQVDDTFAAPVVQSARAQYSMEHVRVTFTDSVDPVSATNLANYSVSGGNLLIQRASLIDFSTVELWTASQAPGSNYTLQVQNVASLSGVVMPAAQTVTFTTPNMVISGVRYDAGTTVTKPSGPPDPISADAGYWALTTNANAGFSAGPLTDDNGTGYNAWQISDNNIANGTGGWDYRLSIDQASKNLARANGWRFVVRSRLADNFFSTGPDQLAVYGESSTSRYLLFFSINSSGALVMQALGFNYIVADASTARDYHTHVLAYDPVTAKTSYYFDGRLIMNNYPAQAAGGYDGIAFGSGSANGAGAMNYNLVQFDVVGGAQPVVTLQPKSSTNGVGQKVTFTAGFSPFVSTYQWLSNDVIIAGATSSSYTTPFITLGYDGSQFKCRALHALGNVETTPATLRVTSDTTPPFVTLTKGSLLLDHVRITYSEPVQESYATNLANYVWSKPGVTNIAARLMDPLTVELRTTPFLANSNYTVLISNVRDTSNLSIAANTPASFLVPAMATLARYYAGNTTDTPNGPPDPTSPAGGSWSLRLDPDANITTNAVVNDFGTGLHAWQVRDASTVFGHFCQYSMPVNTNLLQSANRCGWVLTVFGSMPEDLFSPPALYVQYGDQTSTRYLMNFDLDEAEDLVAGLWTTNTSAFNNYTVTTGSTGLSTYHLHQVVYEPTTASASYYCDGNLISSGWTPGAYADTNSVAGVWWGAAASANLGSMNFNLVQFQAVEFPSVAITSNGTNITVQYRGVLEAATQLGSPTSWTALATNTASAGGTYSAPVASPPQRYFRARLLQ